jgi:hypothetical protein
MGDSDFILIVIYSYIFPALLNFPDTCRPTSQAMPYVHLLWHLTADI